ncbi:MAG: M23 family metallopeptidase [Spirochaetaceae bacterium]|nr:M23 family metallopeptidase [Spirochaetaceae bacterium]
MYKTNFWLILLVLFSCFSVFATTHTVAEGDTLYSISRTYGVTLDDLCKANGISKNKPVIVVGQKLTIPNQKESTDIHVVKKGETFYGIARSNGITVDELLSLNNLTSSDTLKVGQKLIVPGKNSAGNSTVSSNTNTNLEIIDPRKYSEKKTDSSLTWPVKNPKVTYINGKVSGVQLSATNNESVISIRSGTVMFSGVYRGFGKVVFIQSQTGHIYVYTGLNEISVQKSDYVVMGEKIGTVGFDVISGKPQMILMVFQNGKPIDPAKAPRG